MAFPWVSRPWSCRNLLPGNTVGKFRIFVAPGVRNQIEDPIPIHVPSDQAVCAKNRIIDCTVSPGPTRKRVIGTLQPEYREVRSTKVWVSIPVDIQKTAMDTSGPGGIPGVLRAELMDPEHFPV